MVKVLNVAEKPAVAKRLAAILGRGAAQSVSRDSFNPPAASPPHNEPPPHVPPALACCWCVCVFVSLTRYGYMAGGVLPGRRAFVAVQPRVPLPVRRQWPREL